MSHGQESLLDITSKDTLDDFYLSNFIVDVKWCNFLSFFRFFKFSFFLTISIHLILMRDSVENII